MLFKQLISTLFPLHRQGSTLRVTRWHYLSTVDPTKPRLTIDPPDQVGIAAPMHSPRFPAIGRIGCNDYAAKTVVFGQMLWSVAHRIIRLGVVYQHSLLEVS